MNLMRYIPHSFGFIFYTLKCTFFFSNAESSQRRGKSQTKNFNLINKYVLTELHPYKNIKFIIFYILFVKRACHARKKYETHKAQALPLPFFPEKKN